MKWATKFSIEMAPIDCISTNQTMPVEKNSLESQIYENPPYKSYESKVPCFLAELFGFYAWTKS